MQSGIKLFLMVALGLMSKPRKLLVWLPTDAGPRLTNVEQRLTWNTEDGKGLIVLSNENM
jgi:hypothetical protein